MGAKVTVSKAEARRGFVNSLLQRGTIDEVFDRLRCVQFDPLSPIGCNHDLVLRSRVPKYKIGDWQKAAYKKRTIYDGWDKQACLIRTEGWPLRAASHRWSPGWKRVLDSHPEAVEAVLQELRKKGPLEPRHFDFQDHRADWKGSWYGPSVTKRILRALWHTGQVMTHSRRGVNHLYALTEHVLPAPLNSNEARPDKEVVKELMYERVIGMGFLRATAPAEVWPILPKPHGKKEAFQELVAEGRIVEVSIEGMDGYASHEFLSLVHEPVEKRVELIAPLDPILWDRKVVLHVFDFKYIWEVYVPAAKRIWGYYMLPVLFGDQFVGRIELVARKGVLEIREWHWEKKPKLAGFWGPFRKTTKSVMKYSSTTQITAAPGIDQRIVSAFEASAPASKG